MNTDNLYKKRAFKLLCRSGHPISLTVRGVSMEPILLDGDSVTVTARSGYELGDILVFLYTEPDGNIRLLFHRLLAIEHDSNEKIYLCKGDNSFRIEYVNARDICGKAASCLRENRKVELVRGKALKRICFLSLKIGRNWEAHPYLDLEYYSRGFFYRLYKKILLYDLT